jgi:hypothetical protein
MKPALLAVLSLALLVASFGGALAQQKFEDLPRRVQGEVESLQAQLATLQELHRRLDWESKLADPHLKVAYRIRHSHQTDAKRHANRQALREDVAAFVKAGRGTESQFKHWQHHYADSLFTETFDESVRDQNLRTIVLTVLSQYFQYRSGEELEGLTPDEQIKRIRKINRDLLKQKPDVLPAIEASIAPTELEREHVRNDARLAAIEFACHRYCELYTPAELNVLRKQMVPISNRLTSLWPDWHVFEQERLKAEYDSAYRIMLGRGLW